MAMVPLPSSPRFSRPLPSLPGLPEGFSGGAQKGHDRAHQDMQEGVNDLKASGYRGPLPSSGSHRYEIKVYALDSRIDVGNKVRRKAAVRSLVTTSLTLLQEHGVHAGWQD